MNTRRVIEDYVFDADRDDFGDAGSGVIEHSEQRTVALPGPAARFWSIEDGIDLFAREEAEHRSLEALHWNRQGLLNDGQGVQVVVGRVLQE